MSIFILSEKNSKEKKNLDLVLVITMTEMANVRKITGSRTKQPTTFWPKHEHNNKTKSQPRAHTFYRKKINGTREKKNNTTEETTMKIPSSKAPAFVRNFLSFCNEFI